MRNNKGQALVEFVIVIPIFILILLALVDFGSIIHQKYVLENDIDTISELYQLDKTDEIDEYLSKIGADINYEKKDKYVTITLEKNANFATGLLSSAFGKNYKITVSKTIIKMEDK